MLWRAGVGDVVGCTNLTMAGEYKKAIPSCRALVEKMPTFAEAHNNLSWCLTLDDQFPEGLAEARKAVDLEPTRSHYDTLAMALARSGQGKEAMQVETDHVIEGGGVANDSERVTLGMVYFASGHQQDANKQWELAATGTDAVAQKLARRFEAQYHSFREQVVTP